MNETARLGALMIVHAEDGRLLDEGALDGGRYAGFLASRPRAAEEAAIDLVHRPGAGGRRPGARRAPERRRRRAEALRAARADGLDVSVETCPHYLTFDAEHIPDGAHRAQVLPADPRGRQPRGALGRAGRGRHRLRRLRPLAVHRRSSSSAAAATSAPPGAASPRSSWGCPRCGPAPARAATGSPTWCAGWPRATGRPGRAGPQGPDRGRRGRRPGAVRARRGVHRRRRHGCTTATRCRPTPAAGWPVWSGRPGCAAYRWPRATDTLRKDDC